MNQMYQRLQQFGFLGVHLIDKIVEVSLYKRSSCSRSRKTKGAAIGSSTSAAW